MVVSKFFYRDNHTPSPNMPIGVGVLALIERGEALLMERRSDCGRWGLIGGAVEPDEALEDALHREVREETSLDVLDHSLYCISTDPTRIIQYPDGNVVRLLSFVYRALKVRDFDALRCSEESTALRFFQRGELRDLDIVETARPIIDHYLSAKMPDHIILD